MQDIDAFKDMWADIPRVTKDVFAPGVNETIDISVDTRQYEIRISDEIAKSIKWQTVQPMSTLTDNRWGTNRSLMLLGVLPRMSQLNRMVPLNILQILQL